MAIYFPAMYCGIGSLIKVTFSNEEIVILYDFEKVK